MKFYRGMPFDEFAEVCRGCKEEDKDEHDMSKIKVYDTRYVVERHALYMIATETRGKRDMIIKMHIAATTRWEKCHNGSIIGLLNLKPITWDEVKNNYGVSSPPPEEDMYLEDEIQERQTEIMEEEFNAGLPGYTKDDTAEPTVETHSRTGSTEEFLKEFRDLLVKYNVTLTADDVSIDWNDYKCLIESTSGNWESWVEMDDFIDADKVTKELAKFKE
jgi:hypothetical protein